MKVDLNKSLEAVAPWELIITWDGVDYPTKRPSIGLIAQLQTMKTMEVKDSFAMVAEIFQTPGPDLQKWPADAILGALTYYTSYFNQQSGKNSLPIASMTANAMGENSQ